MKTTRACLAAAVVLALAVQAAPAPALQEEADKSDNITRIAKFDYENPEADFFSGGTDIDFSGKYIYATQQGDLGGVHIVKNGKKPTKIGFIPCPGGQNDVAVVKPGLLALGYHSSNCAGAPGGGVRLIDVKNPKKPKYLGAVNNLPGGTHTLTVYPGKPIIYASPGGLPTNGGATEQILDVSNPMKPEVAATFQPNRSGCHDFTFWFGDGEKLGFCTGLGETQIWDVSDPLAPEIIGRTTNASQFQHSVAISHDGKYMIVGDEAVAGNDCVGGPTGALWAYDITNRTLPVPLGYYRAPRGQEPAGSPDVDRNTWCSAHLFNFVPGTYTLVVSWYSGGMNVLDYSADWAQPTELAHYMGTGENITNYWSAYWYDGRIWANDRVKGLDVYEVKGLKEGHHH